MIFADARDRSRGSNSETGNPTWTERGKPVNLHQQLNDQTNMTVDGVKKQRQTKGREDQAFVTV